MRERKSSKKNLNIIDLNQDEASHKNRERNDSHSLEKKLERELKVSLEEENLLKRTSKSSGRAQMEPEKGSFLSRLFAVRNTKKAKNKEFAIITYLFMAIFICMIGYFIYFVGFQSEEVINNSYNPRLAKFSDHVVRGDILSSEGTVLATTQVNEDGSEARVYPYDDMFAHVVGYTSNGNYGVEASNNFTLLRSHSFFLNQIINDLMNKKNPGDSVVTTLDFEVQEAAFEALGDRDGAVVVLEVETGKILAMVSKPDFNPNTIESKWEQIVEDQDNAPLLNRATNGLYPPGSTFKIITTLEYFRENGEEADYTYHCEGTITENGTTIHCANDGVHGEVNLNTAFAKSCNTTYSSIGLSLDRNQWKNLAEQLLFNSKLPTTLDTKDSSFTLAVDEEPGKVMQTAIGQGDTLVTPLHMAQLTAAIANDGEMMKSYVVEQILRDNGSTVQKFHSNSAGNILSAKEAQYLQYMMEDVVQSGTGTKLSGQSYHAAGKTGSAEYGSKKGNSHAWFVGYGSKEAYNDIAIAVLVENGGSGSGTAVPIAKQVFDVYFNQE